MIQMNFKKYHESKNLFDEVYSDIKYETPTYRAIFVGNGTFTLSTTISQFSNFANLFLIAGNVSSGATTQSNGVWSGNPRTVESIDGYVTIAYRHYNNAESNPNNGDTMLNTGSQSQPYEPYSSEVWHDIPYYVRRTSTDTLTLPAVIYGDGTNASLTIKGNTVQNGTPSPSNPVDVVGVGERTANLLDRTTDIIGYRLGQDGSLFKESGYETSEYISVEPSSRIKRNISFMTVKPLCEYDANKEFIQRNTSGAAVVLTSNTHYIRTSIDTSDTDVMLYAGSTALPYEPYGYKIPISSNSVTTNIYLGEVQTTRQIKKVIFDGTEDWSLENPDNFYTTNPFSDAMKSQLVLCSHQQSNGRSFDYGTNNVWISMTRKINFRTTTIQHTIEAWKEFLVSEYEAGHPVTLWYILENSTTATVNEPLQKIGSYSDTLATSISTTDGANTLSVDTQVQPSEVTVSYHGWHPVANTHVMEGLLSDNPLCGISTYKDTLDLSNGSCTRQIKKLMLDGTENWVSTTTNTFRITINDYKRVAEKILMSSHYPTITNVTDTAFIPNETCTTFLVSSSGNNYFYIRDLNQSTTNALKTYLQQQYSNGTPVTVWYVLATPTTETITVPTGLSGTEEGYLNQSDTPTPTNPVYPTANEVPMWN